MGVKGKVVVLSVLLSLSLQFAFAQDSLKVKNVEGTLISPTKTFIENITAAPNFAIFYSVLQSAGLTNTITSSASATILAPTNKAFYNLPAGRLDTLMKPEHLAELTTLVNNHMLAGKITSEDIARQIKMNNGTAVLTTLSGSKLTAKIDANRNILLTDANGNKSVISRFDIGVKNGLMHVVTGVLMPATF